MMNPKDAQVVSAYEDFLRKREISDKASFEKAMAEDDLKHALIEAGMTMCLGVKASMVRRFVHEVKEAKYKR